ncbi:MAG: DUF503 domain-containing protein [Armatimonadota bacterium]|nr:DUF503 domain-containing protein [Armatimonadota bacterium]
MTIGVLTVSIEIPESGSLKDKRRTLRSMLDGLRGKYNISAAELDRQDSWNFSTIGAACISSDKVFVNRVLDSVVGRIRSNPRVVILDYAIEFV